MSWAVKVVKLADYRYIIVGKGYQKKEDASTDRMTCIT